MPTIASRDEWLSARINLLDDEYTGAPNSAPESCCK